MCLITKKLSTSDNTFLAFSFRSRLSQLPTLVLRVSLRKMNVANSDRPTFLNNPEQLKRKFCKITLNTVPRGIVERIC